MILYKNTSSTSPSIQCCYCCLYVGTPTLPLPLPGVDNHETTLSLQVGRVEGGMTLITYIRVH